MGGWVETAFHPPTTNSASIVPILTLCTTAPEPMLNTSSLPGVQPQSLVSLPTVKKTQTLTYEVPFPILGNKVIIEIEGNRLDTIIHQIHKNDKIVLRYQAPGQAVDPPMFFEAGVYAGEWKVPVDQRPHKLIFE